MSQRHDYSVRDPDNCPGIAAFAPGESETMGYIVFFDLPYAHIFVHEEIGQLKRLISGNLEHRFCEDGSKVEPTPFLSFPELKAFSSL